MNITKNRQSMESIRQMVEGSFPDKTMAESVELTEGMCNAIYRIRFTDESTAILKIAAESTQGYMRNEKGLMQVEIDAMRLMEDRPGIFAPRLLHYDDSRTLCSAPYFFMETMEGENFAFTKCLDEAGRNQIYREMGQAIRRMSEVKSRHFGVLGQQEYPSLYELYCTMLRNLHLDSQTDPYHSPFCFEWEELFACLAADRACFDEFSAPCLIHWDLWDGNVFVKDGHISGIIDWERTLWADPLMVDKFRRHSQNPAVLEGYGQTSFSEAEKHRLVWYDLLLYVTMTVEVGYRQYEDRSQLDWVAPLLAAAWKDIRSF